MTRYKQRVDYEGFEVPSNTIYKIACCDCGLVHDFVFVSEDGKPIGIAARRNNRATGQRRRRFLLRPAAQEVEKPQVAVSDDLIREVFLANGFTIKEGQSDLKPYVYAAARALLAKATAEQPADERKDAERYRWMRRTFIADDEAWLDDVADARTGDELDVAVDRALAEEEERNE